MNQGVCVVLDAPDRDRVHAMFLCDARYVRPQFRLEGFRNRIKAVLRAEYDMNVIADVRARHCVVPAGLES